MPVNERPSPYDQWERFKLPLCKRILLLLLSKEERKYIQRRINRINRTRRIEHHRGIEEMKKRLRPPPQRPGAGFPKPQRSKGYGVND